MIVVESGGTKSTWVCRDSKGNLKKFILQGLHPQEINPEKVLAANDLISQNHLIGKDVYFFGAGCESSSGKKRITELLLEIGLNPKMIVSDVVGACMAVLGNDNGVAGILGTGAVAAYYQNQKVQQMTSGRGFILGDEGSGFDIGKRITVACLDGKFTNYPDVEKSIHEYYGGKDKIVHACSGIHSRFKIAGLTEVIADYRENPIINKVLLNSFQDYTETAILPLRHDGRVGMVGSVAYFFREEFSKVLSSNDIVLTKVVIAAVDDIYAFVESKM